MDGTSSSSERLIAIFGKLSIKRFSTIGNSQSINPVISL
jgi:hypothetical protein